MWKIDLREWRESAEHSLTIAQRDALQAALPRPRLSIRYVPGAEGKYTLKPGSTVGAIKVGDLSVLIRPKIRRIPQLLSLACYAIGRVKLQANDFDFPEQSSLPDVLARALGRAARHAFSRGLLHGYLVREEALFTVRGRIRFDEQFRRRPGVTLPIEVGYDEFTDDTLANRLIKAAAVRLAGAGLRSQRARNDLRWIAGMLDNVSLCEWPPNAVPEVTFDRLNEHYRSVVTLSRLVLRGGEFEAHRGGVRASGFLMDMNAVFQEFVTVALREALSLSERTFGESDIPSFDTEGKVGLRPDLVWRHAGRYVFVGDVKYKNVASGSIPNADLHQLLAYVTALDLPGGLLVYAKGEAESATYTVRNCGKRLQVAALDLEGSLDDVLWRIEILAEKVRRLRDDVGNVRVAAWGSRAMPAPARPIC